MSTTYRDILAFVRSLYPGTEQVPLHSPVFVGNERKYLNECIDSTFVSYVGPFVRKFESRIAEYTGVRNAVAFVNGTAALQLALQVAGVQPGDEVVTQALTFVATSNAISHAGATPVFVDIDRSSFGMSPDSLRGFLENNVTTDREGRPVNRNTGSRIAACVPVHVFGHIGGIETICDVCRDYRIPVIEDAAESIGSTYEGRHAGSFGDISIISFNGNKTVTAGAGGMLVTNDDNLAARARHLSTTAKQAHPWEFIHDEIGYNYRMSNLNAAVGFAQMEYIDKILDSKRKIAEAYRAFFEHTEIGFMKEPPGCSSNYWLNTIIAPSADWRDGLLELATGEGVQARAAWRPAVNLRMYADREHTDLTNTMWAYERAVNLPSSPKL